MIKDNIKNDIITAMIDHNEFKRDKLRYIQSLIIKEEKDTKKELNDEHVIKIIEKIIKQNNDLIDKNLTNKKQELLNEIELLNIYIPEKKNEEDTKNIIKLIISSNNFSSLKDLGKCMKLLKEQFGQTIDMKIASKIIKELLK